MQCNKCSTKNINEADYCKNCGCKFTEKEKKKAKRFTIVWFLENIDRIKNIINLEFITGSLLYKIVSIVAVTGIGIYMIVVNGSNLKIKESSEYKVQYNIETKEYYLYFSENKAKLNLYVPNRTNDLSLQVFNQDNSLIEEKEINKDEEIILDKNEDGNYYIIEGHYKNNNLDKIKLRAYNEKDMEDTADE